MAGSGRQWLRSPCLPPDEEATRADAVTEERERVAEQNLAILLKQERTKDWVHLLPFAVTAAGSFPSEVH